MKVIESKNPLEVVLKRFSALASGQFVFGLVLGAVSSLLVNFITVQFENYTLTNTYVESLEQELDNNIKLISENEEKGMIYRAQFQTDAWDSGISNGYIYELNKETVKGLQTLYGEIERENQVRSMTEDHTWGIFYKASENFGKGLYYDNEIKNKELDMETKIDYLNKRNEYYEENDALTYAFNDSVELNLELCNEPNTEIKNSISGVKILMKNENQLNPLVAPMIVLICTSCLFLFIVIFVSLSRVILKRKNKA